MTDTNRGVWIAPWVSERGETVAFSMNSSGRLVHAPISIPHGADRTAFADPLWAELDRVDPIRAPLSVEPPTFTKAPPRRRAALRVL